MTASALKHNLSALDRLLFAFWSLLLGPRQIPRAAVILRPSTLLRYHEALKKRKYLTGQQLNWLLDGFDPKHLPESVL